MRFARLGFTTGVCLEPVSDSIGYACGLLHPFPITSANTFSETGRVFLRSELPVHVGMSIFEPYGSGRPQNGGRAPKTIKAIPSRGQLIETLSNSTYI
jgi:hypothetical protein